MIILRDKFEESEFQINKCATNSVILAGQNFDAPSIFSLKVAKTKAPSSTHSSFYELNNSRPHPRENHPRLKLI